MHLSTAFNKYLGDNLECSRVLGAFEKAVTSPSTPKQSRSNTSELDSEARGPEEDALVLFRPTDLAPKPHLASRPQRYYPRLNFLANPTALLAIADCLRLAAWESLVARQLTSLPTAWGSSRSCTSAACPSGHSCPPVHSHTTPWLPDWREQSYSQSNQSYRVGDCKPGGTRYARSRMGELEYRAGDHRCDSWLDAQQSGPNLRQPLRLETRSKSV